MCGRPKGDAWADGGDIETLTDVSSGKRSVLVANWFYSRTWRKHAAISQKRKSRRRKMVDGKFADERGSLLGNNKTQWIITNYHQIGNKGLQDRCLHAGVVISSEVVFKTVSKCDCNIALV